MEDEPLAEAEITLDAETAHPDLEISEDLKHLSRTRDRKNVESYEKRFDTRLYVLGKEPLSNDKNYWQVSVQDARHWTVGIARENINRKGKIDLTPKEGFWVIEHNGKEYKAYTKKPVKLKIPIDPRTIGIYLHFKKRQLIFYDAGNGRILHIFNEKFAKHVRLYPFLSVWTLGESIHVCSDYRIRCEHTDSAETTHMLPQGKQKKSIIEV